MCCNCFIDQAHSSVERAGLLGGVQLKQLPADDNNKLRGETLRKAIQDDREAGLIPFYVSKKLRGLLESQENTSDCI